MSRFGRSSIIGKRRKKEEGRRKKEEGRRKKEEWENFPVTNYSLLQILKSKIEFPNPQFPNLKSKI
ncbi:MULTISPECIES: hypothetical protein [unclassified Microcoleus]|uniref:hypothetical protein n=1 Tax=unclassified Microcoleus TaxID=2642155 RepID=UPI002FD16C74